MIGLEAPKTTRAGDLDRLFEDADRLAALDLEGRRLYRGLSFLRARLARDEGVPAYRVLSNRQLLTLCETRPRDEAALGETPGIGRLQVRLFGPELLAVLRRPEAPDSDLPADGPRAI